MANEKKHVEKPSKQQIKAWEDQYGDIKIINLDRKVEIIEKKGEEPREEVIDEGVFGYFRKPDRATIKWANAKLSKADGAVDPISPGEVIFNRCWLGGDAVLKSEDKYFFRTCIDLNGWLNEIMGFTISS